MGRRRVPLSAELLELSQRMRGVAARGGGVVTAVQCHHLGADDQAIRSLMRSGTWKRERRGVYAETAEQDSIEAAHHRQCAALLASLSGDTVISHQSAARLLALPLPPGPREPSVSITRRPPAPTNDPHLGDVHVTDYDDGDVIERNGLRVLGGARLVLDCCEVMPPDSALAVADAALRRRLATPMDLRSALHQRRGRPGTRRAALIIERADPLAESWFESMSRWWLLEAGLPRPRLQVSFRDEYGVVRARVDMLMPNGRIAGEADGAGKYADPGALFAEKQREDWLRDEHRLEVVRWVPREMRSVASRARVVGRFHRAALRSRS